MNGVILAADVNFMIKGIFSYQIFGQTVWITTTHVCLLIVILLFVVFGIYDLQTWCCKTETQNFLTANVGNIVILRSFLTIK